MKRFALDEFGRDEFGNDQFTPPCARGCYFGGGGSSGNSAIDPSILKIIQQNYASGQQVANTPFQYYGGQTVAPWTNAQNLGGTLLEGIPNGAGNDWMNQSANTLAGLPNSTGQGLVNQSAGILGGATQPGAIAGQMAQYQNPFTQQVANTTMAQLGQYNQNQLANNASDATKSGAFGGDRLGVQDALTNQAYGQTAASTLANLNSQGFNTALGAAQAGNAQQLQGGDWLGTMGNQNVNANASAAGILGNLGLTNMGAQGAAANNIFNYGQGYQNYGTQALQLPYQQYLAAQQWPVSMQNLLTSSYMGGGAANTANPNASGNFMQGIGGLASGGAGILGGLAQNTNVFPWLGGLFGSGAGAAGSAAALDAAAGAGGAAAGGDAVASLLPLFSLA